MTQQHKVDAIMALKARSIAILKKELRAAEENENRWKQLGKQMGKSEQPYWRATAAVRKSEVELLKLFIKHARAGLAKQTNN